MSSSHFKHDLFTQFARVAKAMGNANRLELIEFLAQGERSVEALAKVSGLSIANTSQHLQQLRQTGLVVSRKQGLKVYYRLAGDDVIALMASLRAVAERGVAEIDRLLNLYLTVKDSLEPIASEELQRRLQDGLVTVIDVRPNEEYQAGHLRGALNIPLSELDQYLAQLSPDKEIIAYCRGPHCVLAYDAVARLREQGLQARRLDGGYPEWRLAGLPTEATKA